MTSPLKREAITTPQAQNSCTTPLSADWAAALLPSSQMLVQAGLLRRLTQNPLRIALPKHAMSQLLCMSSAQSCSAVGGWSFRHPQVMTLSSLQKSRAKWQQPEASRLQNWFPILIVTSAETQAISNRWHQASWLPSPLAHLARVLRERLRPSGPKQQEQAEAARPKPQG